MSDEHDEFSEQLRATRPIPLASFRGDLRRRLLALGPPPARPRRLRLLAAGYATAGAVLLAVALAGVLGVGPLAA